MMDLPDQGVSVIVPVYNRSDLLSEAVESAIAQSYRPIEIIIIDDGSTDPLTRQHITRLEAGNPSLVRSARIPNSGPGMARQRGFEMARGEFIQFLDSDDLLLPSKFECQVAGLRVNLECVLSYGKTREYVIGERPLYKSTRRTGEVHQTIFPAALSGRLWATETPLFRRKALEKIGSWSSLRVLEDWEYECRLGAMGARLQFCDVFVSDHRHHQRKREGLRWQNDLQAFKDMLTAHVKVLGYARDAGIVDGSLEMLLYARNLFRLARDAGTRDLANEANKLLLLATDLDPSRRVEYQFYGWLAKVLGWRRAAVLGERFSTRFRRDNQRARLVV